MNTDAKKILKIGSLSVFLLFIIVYSFFISKDVIFGVKITDVNIATTEALPMDSIGKASGIRKITGNAKNAIYLTLNDRPISVDQKGNFDETIALLSGYNVISIKAKDKFGNSDEKNYQLIK
ncbi:MAG: hypothetical protein AAB970_00110 [Patescibacteria group bacterium]